MSSGMRVAFVITRSDAIGGAHVHVRDMARHLAADGHEAMVFAGGNGPYFEDLESHGVRCRSVERLVRPIDPINDSRAVFELRRHLSEFRPSIVSTHSSKAGWLGRLACRSLGVPVVFTAHGWAFTDGVPPLRRRAYRLAERLVAPLANRIITVSEHDRMLALDGGVCGPGRVVAVHNGMPDVSPELMAEPGGETPKLVMVGRFEAQKDQPLLLKALAGLQELPWRASFIGDGPLLPAARELAESLGIAPRVEFLGARRDVAEQLASSQLFALVTHWEGFPRSILEAMRAGLPVITSDVGGCAESVQDGETGLVVPPSDLGALTRGLSTLVRDGQRRVAMGEAGRERYVNEFTFARMYRRTVGVYREVLGLAPQADAANDSAMPRRQGTRT